MDTITSDSTHGTKKVNGISLHYVIAGEGEPLVLLHGWPQTWYEWRHVIPKLADEYTVIAPDLRGMGDSERPRDGYDNNTVATDIHMLVHNLGYETVSLVGHDWGMPTAYAYAAQHRDEVRALAVLDAVLPGIRTDEKPRMLWHVPFHQIRDLPERLVAGNERVYLSWFYRELAYDPSAIDDDVLEEYLRCYSSSGGLRGGFEYYRAFDANSEQNQEHAKNPLEIPVLALGGQTSFRDQTIKDMEAVATDVDGEVVERTGHWIPEERPDYLADRLLKFFNDTNT